MTIIQPHATKPFTDSRWQSLSCSTYSIAWLIAVFTVLRLLLAAAATGGELLELDPAPGMVVIRPCAAGYLQHGAEPELFV